MEQIGRMEISGATFMLNFTSRDVRDDEVWGEPPVNTILYRALVYENCLHAKAVPRCIKVVCGFGAVVFRCPVEIRFQQKLAQIPIY